MTPDEAVDVLAEEVICAAVREILDNGLLDSYVEEDLDDATHRALRDRLKARLATRSNGPTAAQAVAVLARAGET